MDFLEALTRFKSDISESGYAIVELKLQRMSPQAAHAAPINIQLVDRPFCPPENDEAHTAMVLQGNTPMPVLSSAPIQTRPIPLSERPASLTSSSSSAEPDTVPEPEPENDHQSELDQDQHPEVPAPLSIFDHNPPGPAPTHSVEGAVTPEPTTSATNGLSAASPPFQVPESAPALSSQSPPQIRIRRRARSTGNAGAHVCDRCNASFQYRSRLARHVDFVHNLKRGRDCELCPRSFFYNADLIKHTQLVHRRERPFPCTVPGCRMSFQVRSQLRRHVQTRHTADIGRHSSSIGD